MARRKVTDGLTLLASGLYERKITLKDGRRKAFRSKEPSEVWRKIEEFNENEEKGPFFKTVAEMYYSNKIENAKNGTKKTYSPACNFWINEFSDQRLACIEPIHIKACFNKMAAQGFGQKTIANRKIVLKGIFDIWITSGDWNGCANPVTLVKLPQGLKASEREPPTEQQIKIVKLALDNTHQLSIGAIMAATYMYTGVRRGEGLALRLCDVNFEKGLIEVNKQIEHVNNHPCIIDTKTKSSIRQIPLLEPFKLILKNFFLNKPAETYLLGCRDTPLSQTEYTTHWVNFCKENNIAHFYTNKEKRIRNGKTTIVNNTVWRPDVTAHQFRHEFCTIMYESGIPEEVAVRIMGHSDSKMIHRVYLHIREKMITDASIKLSEHFKNIK